MTVVFHIPGYLRPFTDGSSQVEIEVAATTVGAALDALWQQYPGVRDRIVNEQGNVRQHVNVFLGEDSIRHTGGLDTPMSDRAEISIVPAVSGG